MSESRTELLESIKTKNNNNKSQDYMESLKSQELVGIMADRSHPLRTGVGAGFHLRPDTAPVSICLISWYWLSVRSGFCLDGMEI